MKRPRSMRWRHVFFPEIGRRVTGRRWWGNRPLPLMIWPYYAVVAWVTPRLVAVVGAGVVPALLLFLFVVENAATPLGFALTALLLATVGLGRFCFPTLEVRSVIPARVECGRSFPLRYALRNRGRRAAYDLDIESLPYANPLELRLWGVGVAVLPGGQALEVEGRGQARRRGRYVLPPLRWDTDFPLGMWRWGRTDWTPRPLTVFPSYTRLVELNIPPGRRNRLEQHSARHLTRSALEFHGCREFRTGDALRHVHPRSSARLGIPVVKEFQAEGRGRTALLVDTWRTLPGIFGGSWPDPVVEGGLSLAAAMSDYLARTDRVLELLVAGPDHFRFVSAGREGFIEDVLDILASVEPCTKDPLPGLSPLLIEEIRAIQSVCLILGRWDARRAALAQELAAHQVGVKIVLVCRRGQKAPPGFPPDAVLVNVEALRRGEVTVL